MAPGTFKVEVPGAYAEYFVPYRNDFVKKVPDNASLEEAAMIEPTVTGYRALKLAGLKKGEKVLVAGGGIIGTMCAQWAKQMGASYVALTEVNKKRAQMVKNLGFVDDVFDPTVEGVAQEMLSKTGNGFDVFVDCPCCCDYYFGISH
jgi:(R,R)-butanediol dehydrogenase/meso-butanediol dehydrogenase/diacetyl reductase